MKAFNSSPLENGPAGWSHPSLCRRSRRPKQAARRAELNRYPDFGFDLTPAFPTPPGGARRRSVAWWEFVARYSGATVPDSHGVPGHLAATAGWRTIPDTFKELGDPAPSRPILASKKFSRRKFSRAASSSPSSPREERAGRGPRRGETNKNAPPLPCPLLHPIEEREKSRNLMQPCRFSSENIWRFRWQGSGLWAVTALPNRKQSRL